MQRKTDSDEMRGGNLGTGKPITAGSTLELGAGVVLGAIEKAAPPAMLAATVIDIGGHANCSTLSGGALVTPSEGMYGAIP
jgi:hypothetical protein